jgi:hypothetical protein
MTMKNNAQEPNGPPCDCPKFKNPRARYDWMVLHTYSCLLIRRAGRPLKDYYK